MTQDNKPNYPTAPLEARDLMGTGTKSLITKQQEAIQLGASAINVTGISRETLLNTSELTGWRIDRTDPEGQVFLRKPEDKKQG